MNWALTFVRVTVIGAAFALSFHRSLDFSRPPAFAGAGFSLRRRAADPGPTVRHFKRRASRRSRHFARPSPGFRPGKMGVVFKV